jgi:hypothetical protein
MINEDTPYKLAEIIRNTWPQLYLLNRVAIDNQQGFTHGSAPVIPRVLNKKDLIDNQ